MNTVILEVRSLADTLADSARAMNTGHAEGEVRIGFPPPSSCGRCSRPNDGSCSRQCAGRVPCLSAKRPGVSGVM